MSDSAGFDKTSNPNLSRLLEVGVPEFESGTSSLSATRSNQLSYTPLSDLGHAELYSYSSDHWSREAAKCTETRLSVKGKKPHVMHRIGDFFDTTRDFAVHLRVFDFADFHFWDSIDAFWFGCGHSQGEPCNCILASVLRDCSHCSSPCCNLLRWHKIDISSLATVSHTTGRTPPAVGPVLWPEGGRGEDFLKPKFMESIE